MFRAVFASRVVIAPCLCESGVERWHRMSCRCGEADVEDYRRQSVRGRPRACARRWMPESVVCCRGLRRQPALVVHIWLTDRLILDALTLAKLFTLRESPSAHP